ncbi:MAG: ElyC/SanA/YdcF family protein, partial [Anaerovorax sp.]
MKKQNNPKKKRMIRGVLVLLLIAMIPVAINSYVVKSTESHILNPMATEQEPSQLSQTLAAEAKSKNGQCLMVLGGGLKPDGTPNYMLADRLDMGIALYKQGVAPKLLLTGDNGQERYDEVNAMKKYALDRGVPKEDIFMDHAGFSTYESVYRAKAVFDV